MYERNTESLYGFDKNATKFDLEPEKLQGFMALFETRAKRCSWNELLTYANANGTRISIIDHYGSVTHAQVRTKALDYLPLQGRTSQDSEQIYQCLLASVTAEAFNRLKNLSERFNVSVMVDGVMEVLTDGPLLLVTIIGSSYTNTRAMGTIYRKQMTKLDEKIKEIPNANIELFNAHVKQLRNLLAAGGGTCDDLQYNLFEAYKQTGDAEFTTYIKQKELAWKDGILQLDTLGTQLMALGENYYRDAKASGVWMQASNEQTRIMALEAQLTQATITVKALQGAVSQGHGRKIKTDRRERNGPRPLRDEDAWKKVPPATTDAQTKRVHKKTYHWCAAHKMWCIHTASECRLAQQAAPVMSTVVEDSSSDDNDSFAADSDSDSQDSNTN